MRLHIAGLLLVLILFGTQAKADGVRVLVQVEGKALVRGGKAYVVVEKREWEVQLAGDELTQLIDDVKGETNAKLFVRGWALASPNQGGTGFTITPTALTGSEVAVLVPCVRLKEVAEKSPAASAGLVKGDIILEVGRKRVVSDIDLRLIIQNTKPGSEIDVTIQRGTDLKSVPVTVAANRTIGVVPEEHWREKALKTVVPVPGPKGNGAKVEPLPVKP